MYLKKIFIWFLRFLLFLVVFSGLVASAVSAVITVVPDSAASKMSMLGYKAHCSFAPVSTTILVIMASLFGLIFVRVYGKKFLQIARAREK